MFVYIYYLFFKAGKGDNKMSVDLVKNIICRAAHKLSALPFVVGIVLGGSRARGTHDDSSDIDIGIYYNPCKPDLAALNQMARELDDQHRDNLVVPPGARGEWVNAGGWICSGWKR